MSQWQFETLDPAYGQVSEGPAWDGSGLLYTRIQQSQIMRFDRLPGSVSVWRENTNCANGLTFDAQGRSTLRGRCNRRCSPRGPL